MHNFRRPAPVWRCLAALLLLASAGCGAGTYEARLRENSIPYFELREQQGKNLGSQWTSANIRFTPPAEFKEVRAPSDADEKRKGRDADPRQPKFLEAPLPGLLGVWRADIPVGSRVPPSFADEGDAEDEDNAASDSDAEADVRTEPAYIFLLSNLGIGEKDSLASTSFDALALNRVALSVGLPASSLENLSGRPVRVGEEKFAAEKSLLRYEIDAAANLADVPMVVNLNRYKERSTFVMVVYLHPKEAGRGFAEDIELSLESLDVDRSGGRSSGADGDGGSSDRGGGSDAPPI
jgi:hypothetical protein